MKLATLCYVRKDGKTLMLHRVKKKNDMHQGKWNGLGGKVEPGESLDECAIREVKEESGLRVKNPQFKGFITFPSFDGTDDWHVGVYLMTEFEGELIDSNEGNLAWIDSAKLKEIPLWEGDHIFLPWLDQDKIFIAKFCYINGRLKSHSVVFH